MTHLITFVFGIFVGAMFLANSKFFSIAWINKSTGLNHLSLNEQALVFAAAAITIGLIIRAIARANGSQRTGGK